ncbi:hypothetical protein [Terriglobus saanensis]|uniref:hypothetical protein n=1 Tax=Terriglobus saanensis TaxID=870903 RepID=UPI001C9E12A2|nr:hypothetical protein [Terriglobus saanensis]
MQLIYSQGPEPSSGQAISSSPVWRSEHASHLLGLMELAPNLKGSLALSPNGVVFTTPSGETTIEHGHVLAVSAGNVRMEMGGKAGRVGRMLIPFGGGAVLAAVAQGQVDLLTVEFRDVHDAYHGAVFLLPKSEALAAAKVFGLPLAQGSAEEEGQACGDVPTAPASMKLASIAVEGQPIPAEYRVLLYEQMIRGIHADARFGQIFRDGDRSPAAHCPEFQLKLTLTTFTKGNAALRSTAGPLGLFWGVTSLKVHVQLVDRSGAVIFNRDFKESERGDTDTLDIANKIAKSVTKKLKKTAAHHKVELEPPPAKS